MAKYYDDGIYDQKTNEDIADSLEKYSDEVKRFIIPDGKSAKKVKKALKVIKKTVKKLREGKADEVFDEDAYLEYMENMRD